MQHSLLTAGAGLATVFAATPFLALDQSRSQERLSPVDLHAELLTGLDRGDVAAVRKMFTADPLLYLVDSDGRPVRLSGPRCIESLISLWNRGTEDPAPSQLLCCDVLRDDPSTTVTAFEFERPSSSAAYFRATSTLVRDAGRGGEARFHHLHISVADRDEFLRR